LKQKRKSRDYAGGQVSSGGTTNIGQREKEEEVAGASCERSKVVYWRWPRRAGGTGRPLFAEDWGISWKKQRKMLAISRGEGGSADIKFQSPLWRKTSPWG